MSFTTYALFLPEIPIREETINNRLTQARRMISRANVPGAAGEAIDELLGVIDVMGSQLAQLRQHNHALNLALDNAIRLVHLRIDASRGAGPLASRPAPTPNGITWLSSDETPEVLYVAYDDTWHAIDTNL